MGLIYEKGDIISCQNCDTNLYKILEDIHYDDMILVIIDRTKAIGEQHEIESASDKATCHNCGWNFIRDCPPMTPLTKEELEAKKYE